MASELKKSVQDADAIHKMFGNAFPFEKNYTRWTQMPEFKNLIDQVGAAEGAETEDQTVTFILLNNCGWAQDGFNTFELDDATVSLLMATDAQGEFRTVHPPFRTQMLIIPRGWIRVNHKGETHDITRFWLSVADLPADSGFTRRVSVCTNDDFSLHAWRNPEDWFNYESGAPEDESYDTAVELMLRLSASFSLWMATKPGRMYKSTSKGKKSRKERARPTRWYVGKRSPIPRDFVNTVKGAVGQGSLKGKKLSMQHVVRGHYKKQPCGQGLTERKIVWVEPYWRGPDSEEAWARIYE